jgi:hypothetical protein
MCQPSRTARLARAIFPGLRKAETIGDEAFLNALERETGRPLKYGKPGPRAKINALSP